MLQDDLWTAAAEWGHISRPPIGQDGFPQDSSLLGHIYQKYQKLSQKYHKNSTCGYDYIDEIDCTRMQMLNSLVQIYARYPTWDLHQESLYKINLNG